LGCRGIGALLLVVLLSILITRAIRDPLARVQEAAERAAAGDLDAEVGITTADETGLLACAFDSMLGNLRNREQLLRVDHRRQELDGQVHRALEMADDEVDAVAVVGRTLAEVVPGKSAELLLADSSKAHLMQAVVSGPDPAGPACSVESPFACTAVRSGHTMAFDSSESLDACPKLRGRAIGPCSASRDRPATSSSKAC
jgi:HAMP domain-containing protein